jgi:hypothetical protein
MIKALLPVFLIVFISLISTFPAVGQDTKTSDSLKAANPNPVKKDIAATPPSTDTASETGISVSPSTLRYNVKPGSSQTKTIKVSNDTRKSYSFQITFQDYGVSNDGSQDVAVNQNYHNALSKYIVVSPTLLELKPREAKTISVTVDIPPGDSFAIAMWTTLALDQMIERPKLESQNGNNGKTLGLGVNAGVGFGVNIHQNPPNVVINSVEIQSMRFEKATEKSGNSLIMKAMNTGDGIGYCLYYIELTNLTTGKQKKLKVKQFGILPGYTKEFKFELPKELEKGKYSALSVIDFGNKDELQTAELEFSLE